MGSAVSGISNTIGSIISPVSSGISSVGSSALSPIVGSAAGLSGEMIQQLVNNLIPNVPIADQRQLLQQILEQRNVGLTAANQAANLQNQANTQFGTTQGAIGRSEGAVQNAQNVNQGQNVAGSLGLLSQTARGEGPAQQAAQAQLQAGKDAAIQAQQAMANSGNLSQMISGQKTAMDNAANLVQQAANQSALMRAQMSANAQPQYASAAAQQASQAAQNAGLEQTQAQQQANLYGQQLGSAQTYAGLGQQGLQNAAANQLGAQQLQQQALGQTAGYRAQALGGLMNAGGGVASAMLSDETKKENIKDGKKPIAAFLEAIEAKQYEYKEPKSKAGDTPGVHLGILAQDVEKAPGGKSMIIEKPEGKHIDIPSAVGMLMAAAADTHDRVKELEELFNSRKK